MHRDVMLELYHKHSIAKSYILGFTYKDRIYYGTFNHEIFTVCIVEDYASRKNGNNGSHSLRYYPHKLQRVAMLPYCKELCTIEEFEQMRSATIYNRGDFFESLIFKLNGQEWRKDRVPFFVGPDIWIGGVAYQIKYLKSSVCNEGVLKRFL